MPLRLSGTDPVSYRTTVLNADLIKNYQVKFDFPQTAPNFISDGTPLTDSFTSVLDGLPVVRTYNDFVVNAGHVVTTSNRCKGLYINVLGNLVINGKLSMTARGASCPGQHVIIDKDYRQIYFSNALESGFDYSPFTLINKDGGQGAAPYLANPNPVINSKGACGAGGGTGGKEGTTAFLTTRGGHGTSFSGGAGAGGGAIHLFHKGDITNQAKIVALGGAPGFNSHPEINKVGSGTLSGSRYKIAQPGGNGTVNIMSM